MKLKKYRPRFFSGFEDEYYEINSREELFNSELCKHWVTDGFILSLLNDGTLMAINNEHWYVISTQISREDCEILKEWIYLVELPNYKFK